MFKQFLNEYFLGKFQVMDYGTPAEVKVYRNPGQTEFETLLDRSHYKELKGFIVGNDIFVWDGESGIHEIVADALGIREWDGAFYIGLNKAGHQHTKQIGKYVVAAGANQFERPSSAAWKSLFGHPAFMTMLGHPAPIARTA